VAGPQGGGAGVVPAAGGGLGLDLRGWANFTVMVEYMKNLGILGIVVATTVTAVFPLGNRLSAKPNAAVEAATNQEVAKSTVPSKERDESSEQDLSALPEEKAELHPEPLEHMLVAAPVGVGWDGQRRLAGGALARRQHSSNSNTAERVPVPGERPGLI
jgi:hypothetical protein